MEENKDLKLPEGSSEEADIAENETVDGETEMIGEQTDGSDTEHSGEKKGNSLLNDIVEIAESTLITVFVMMLVFTYILHPVNVVGKSMYPTLNDGDRVFMTTVYGKPKYGDIVVINNDAAYFLDNEGKPYKEDPSNNPLIECIIKRVIAGENQTIEIDNSAPDPQNWCVKVDGKVLDEPYLALNAVTSSSGAFDGKFPFTVPEGYCFVMGDNRTNSSDSRSIWVGLVKEDQIIGKAIIRYAPLDELRILVNSYKETYLGEEA